MATTLAGELGGDVKRRNRAPFGAEAATIIRNQIGQFQSRMADHDIPAGSPLALRLFSCDGPVRRRRPRRDHGRRRRTRSGPCAEIARHDHACTCSTRRRFDAEVRSPVPRAAGHRARRIRRCAVPTRRRSGWAARRSRSSPRCATACPCCRSPPRQTPRGEQGRSRSMRACAALGLDEDDAAVAYAAELKFDGLAISLRYEGRRARADRYPRRRRTGRTSRATCAR